MENRVVNFEEGQSLANSFNIKFYECSAKTGSNIENVFLEMGKDILLNTNLTK